MSFLRPRVWRPRGRGWSLASSATFAARRDFELLKLLSTADPSVVAMARRLGASFDDSAAEHVPQCRLARVLPSAQRPHAVVILRQLNLASDARAS